MAEKVFITIPKRDYEILKENEQLFEEFKTDEDYAIIRHLIPSYDRSGMCEITYRYELVHRSKVIEDLESQISELNSELFEKQLKNNKLDDIIIDLQKSVRNLKKRGFWSRVFNLNK